MKEANEELLIFEKSCMATLVEKKQQVEEELIESRIKRVEERYTMKVF